jgi:hypothetical protein
MLLPQQMRSVGKRAHDESGKHPVNEDDEEMLRVPVKLRVLVPRHCERSEAIHCATKRKNGLLRR